jgi:hypothetical protein
VAEQASDGQCVAIDNGTVRGCRVRATMVARYTDGQGRRLKQRELCERHSRLAQGESPQRCMHVEVQFLLPIWFSRGLVL